MNVLISLSPCLLISFQGDDELRRWEAERIAGKRPLTREERESHRRPGPGKSQAPVRGYSLAVVPLSFTDASPDDPAPLLLRDVRDWYAKASDGAFALVGKAYATVPLGCARDEVAKLAVRSEEERRRLTAAVEAWMRRDGEGVLAAHDGVAFVAAGKLGPRDSALWPHEGTLESGLRYVVVPSDGGAHALGIAAHEFGHLLGLADKYDAGPWCLMAKGYAESPVAPLCAPCRLRLGWIGASAAEGRTALHAGDAVRIAVTDRETLVLEFRRKLLVWRVAATIELAAVLPSRHSDRLTPFSDPPFVGRSAGAREVWITDVRIEEGVAFLTVAPSGALTRAEEVRKSRIGQPIGK